MTEKILTVLFVFIKTLIASTGYGGVAILMAIESACIPLPSELIMPFAGYLVYTGTFNLWWAATAGAIGCNIGSLVAYEIGRYGGRPLVERYGRWILLSHHELDVADGFFMRHGFAAVFFCPAAAGDSHVHCITGRHCAHATGTLSYLYFSRFVAVVLRAGLCRHEARAELARNRQVLP